MFEEINVNQIFSILRKRILFIIFTTLIFIGIAAGITYYMLTPIYQTSTEILVSQERTEATTLTNQDIQTDLQLINTYIDIIKSPFILDPVIEDLSLNMSADALNSKIVAEESSNSQVFSISVQDSDPELAVNVANSTALVFQSRIQDLMNVDNVTILSPAVLKPNPAPISPNPIRNMLVAAAAGLILSIGISILLAYMDTTIKNEQDIDEHLGVPLLAVISPIVEKDKVKKATPVALKKKEAFRIW
ncbi:YveK family protein [Planococcus salinarum]|uniref:YveK family protein n=1 Tax=Planococcus salinarum TaxID=622695 RepID=UPI000E3CDEF9|nr:Wzz/FepE/Etk N-terminal domain-containing protein [Planococcus salinarum]TAA72289.1 capsular biosynthesis protein [Planococcus salinarum]